MEEGKLFGTLKSKKHKMSQATARINFFSCSTKWVSHTTLQALQQTRILMRKNQMRKQLIESGGSNEEQ